MKDGICWLWMGLGIAAICLGIGGCIYMVNVSDGTLERAKQIEQKAK